MTVVADPSAHAAGVEDALKVALGGVRLHVDEVPPSPGYPYAVLYTDAGGHADDSLGLQMEHATFYPVVVSVGVSAAQCRMVRDRVVRVLAAGVTVAGRDCRLTSLSSTQIARDTDIPDRVVFFGRDLFRLDSWAN